MLANALSLAITSLAFSLTACGGESKPASSADGQSPSPAQQVAAAEQTGQLAQLDRSSDIRGPDKDSNGIRDDIDAWIAAQPISDAQKKAAKQVARVQQSMLLADLNDTDALQKLGERSAAAVVCISDTFSPERQIGRDLDSQIEAMTANTKERAKKYIAYNRAVSGSSGRLPEGKTCEP